MRIEKQCCVAACLASLAGMASGQIETRDWLQPVDGFWSYASKWSGGDVPDTFLELARLSPGANRAFGGSPIVAVDGVFEVERVVGNGSVDVNIPAGSSLFTQMGVYSENGTLRIFVGDDSASPLAATLSFDASRAMISDTEIHLVGASGNAVLETIENQVVVSAGSSVTGQGTIRGRISNAGLIESQQHASGQDQLLFDSEFVNNNGIIRSGPSTTITFLNTRIIHPSDGSLVNGGRMVFDGCEINDGTLSNIGRASTTVTGMSAIDGLVIDESSGFKVHEGTLELRGGELRNDGFISMRDASTIDLAEDTTLMGEGQIEFWRPEPRLWFDSKPHAVLTNGVEHCLFGRGDMNVSLINQGLLWLRRVNPTDNILTINGEFEQQSSGLLDITATDSSGQPTGDMLLIDSNSVVLGGSLLVRHIGVANEVLGQPLTLIRILDRQPGQALTGEFESVEVRRSGGAVNTSRIPQMLYHDDRVEVAFFCKADVNRNGSVEPTDFTAWIDAFNRNSPLADIDENDVIDSDDFTSWMFFYNQPCGN